LTSDKNIQVSADQNDGSSIEKSMSWHKALIEDFLGRGVATECWNGIKSEVALRTRTETVDDVQQVNLAGLQAKWASTGDVY
jgi:hypothetical protein